MCLGRRRSRHGGSAVRGLISFRVGRPSGARAGSIGVPGQGLGRLPRGLLNGSGVMVLVARESGTPSEGLLACGVRAFVRSFTRVNATMSGERAGITEGLQNWGQQRAIGRQSSLRTHLATSLAHVGLLAGVDTLVDSQCRALDELLATVGEVADMRPDTGVDALCCTSQYPNFRQDKGRMNTNHDEQDRSAWQMACGRSSTGRSWRSAGRWQSEREHRTCPAASEAASGIASGAASGAASEVASGRMPCLPEPYWAQACESELAAWRWGNRKGECSASDRYSLAAESIGSVRIREESRLAQEGEEGAAVAAGPWIAQASDQRWAELCWPWHLFG